jgi:hypothetical protein
VTEKWTNPEVLRWAREWLNPMPLQVAEESKKLARHHFAPVTEQKVADREAGRAEPELAPLERRAEIYTCLVGYFGIAATGASAGELSGIGEATRATPVAFATDARPVHGIG